MKVMPALPILIAALLAADHARGERIFTRFTPKKTGDDIYSFTVKAERVRQRGGGDLLDFHVTAKVTNRGNAPASPDRRGELCVFDGAKLVSSCRVQPTGRPGEQSFSFRVASGYAEKSTFTFAHTEGELDDGFYYWFYLGDFVEPDGDTDPLGTYPPSDAFKANLAWHRQVGENEIRTSWFLGGNPGIAMVCAAELSASRVSTSREVHDHASQSRRTRELSHAQVETLRKLIQNLPPSAKTPELRNLVLVTISEKGQPKTYLYNRLDPPREIIRLYDLTGAYLDTEPPPQADEKPDQGLSDDERLKLLKPVMTLAEVKRLWEGKELHGQGCGLSVNKLTGKTGGAYWDVYLLKLKNSPETQSMKFGYFQDGGERIPFELRGPGFHYYARDGKYVAVEGPPKK